MQGEIKKFFIRCFDVLFSLFALSLSSPLFLILALLIKIESEGPVFYLQHRLGLNKKLFLLFKFRSMRIDGDRILEEFLSKNPPLREEWERYKKLKSFDPRLTRVGKFIRKYNIDELPQFINVLKGDMTLVGPRPYLPREINDMGNYVDIILKVKPGLAGPWQVSGRNELTFKERLEIDANYVRNRSLKSDVVYLLKTVLVTLKGTGF